jgi:hypothetical protein
MIRDKFLGWTLLLALPPAARFVRTRRQRPPSAQGERFATRDLRLCH